MTRAEELAEKVQAIMVGSIDGVPAAPSAGAPAIKRGWDALSELVRIAEAPSIETIPFFSRDVERVAGVRVEKAEADAEALAEALEKVEDVGTRLMPDRGGPTPSYSDEALVAREALARHRGEK